MTSFYADAAQVQAFSTTVSDLSGGVATAKTYASTWTPVSGGEDGWIFANFAGAAEGIESGVAAALTHLQTLTRESAAELADTATYYETTDAEQAAVLDTTYPGTP